MSGKSMDSDKVHIIELDGFAIFPVWIDIRTAIKVFFTYISIKEIEDIAKI